jgi:hypothetical protein
MVIALRQIWSENLRRISVDVSEDSIKLLLKLSNKLKVNGIEDIVNLIRLFVKCLLNNKLNFGTNGAFFFARVKDIRVILNSIRTHNE